MRLLRKYKRVMVLYNDLLISGITLILIGIAIGLSIFEYISRLQGVTISYSLNLLISFWVGLFTGVIFDIIKKMMYLRKEADSWFRHLPSLALELVNVIDFNQQSRMTDFEFRKEVIAFQEEFSRRKTQKLKLTKDMKKIVEPYDQIIRHTCSLIRGFQIIKPKDVANYAEVREKIAGVEKEIQEFKCKLLELHKEIVDYYKRTY